MAGEMRQAGNVAKFELRRTASAQVEAAPRSTAVATRPCGPMDRRIRARRLSAPRHDHARKSRRRRATRGSSSSASRRPTSPSISSPRTAASCASSRRRITSRSKDVTTSQRRVARRRRTGVRRAAARVAPFRREAVMKHMCVASCMARRSSRPAWWTRNRRFAATPRMQAPIRAKGRASFIASNGGFRPATGSFRRRSTRTERSTSAATTGTSTPSMRRRASALEAQYRRTGCARRPRSRDGVVYVGSYDGKFYALDARTGAMRWRIAT